MFCLSPRSEVARPTKLLSQRMTGAIHGEAPWGIRGDRSENRVTGSLRGLRAPRVFMILL